MASVLAAARRKLTSSPVKSRGDRLWTPRTPQGGLAPADDDAEPADHPVLAQQLRRREARVGTQVLEHDGIGRVQRRARVLVGIGAEGRVPDDAFTPADAGAEEQAVAVRQELEDRGVLHAEGGRHAADELVHELVRLQAAERQQAEIGDSGLLRGSLLERLLTTLVLRGVAHHAQMAAGQEVRREGELDRAIRAVR
jgi:hypothetical protein